MVPRLNDFQIPAPPEISEARLQQNCFMWHYNQYPHMRGLFFRIKNEGTNAISGARDKAIGVVAGVADMCMLTYHGAIFIEFKSPKGNQSPKQKDWQVKVTSAGYSYFVIRTEQQFKDLCQTLDL